jgi:hypothetical protein
MSVILRATLERQTANCRIFLSRRPAFDDRSLWSFGTVDFTARVAAMHQRMLPSELAAAARMTWVRELEDWRFDEYFYEQGRIWVRGTTGWHAEKLGRDARAANDPFWHLLSAEGFVEEHVEATESGAEVHRGYIDLARAGDMTRTFGIARRRALFRRRNQWHRAIPAEIELGPSGLLTSITRSGEASGSHRIELWGYDEPDPPRRPAAEAS